MDDNMDQHLHHIKILLLLIAFILVVSGYFNRINSDDIRVTIAVELHKLTHPDNTYHIEFQKKVDSDE
jgi:uncharacterized membrane protein